MTADSEALRIVAATDLDPGREATATAAGAAFRRTFEDVVRDPEVEGVILCTPHEFHAEQAISAAERGKHVFCEKPLCLTLADAERVVQACERAGVVLGIGHERRFEPPIVDLMTRITTGELGTILQIEGNFSQDKFLSLSPDNWRIRGAGSVGPMTATGIHVLDLSTAILGPATRVAASVRSLATSFENGDSLAVMIDFENGGAALISAILATPFDGRFAAYGSLGWAEIRDKSHRRTLRVGSRPMSSGASPGRSRNILALPRLVSISRPSRGQPEGNNPIPSRPIRCFRRPPRSRRCSSRRGAANGGWSAESATRELRAENPTTRYVTAARRRCFNSRARAGPSR